jgi:hypothetical protein
VHVRVARLPVAKYCSMTTTRILTVNHVLEILLRRGGGGESWPNAFEHTLPGRKDMSVKSEGAPPAAPAAPVWNPVAAVAAAKSGDKEGDEEASASSAPAPQAQAQAAPVPFMHVSNSLTRGERPSTESAENSSSSSSSSSGDDRRSQQPPVCGDPTFSRNIKFF